MSEWIRFDDQLPEEGRSILVYPSRFAKGDGGEKRSGIWGEFRGMNMIRRELARDMCEKHKYTHWKYGDSTDFDNTDVPAEPRLVPPKPALVKLNSLLDLLGTLGWEVDEYFCGNTNGFRATIRIKVRDDD